ncbi:MAG: 7-cyano-7-deazaguanine synthase, partial [Syntrophorhabdales bacterium]
YDFGNPPPAVSLFSGGIDSLAGAINLINASSRPVLLVSHQSQSGTKRTQKQLFEALKGYYGERVVHYAFECNLHGARGIDESQRSRSFLYTAIALAVASASHAKEIHVFENGVTSMNFARRQDLINGRASRTTHPKSLRLLQALYSLVMDRPFTILAPYFSKTKAEVIKKLKDGPHPEFISSTVSCGRTIRHPGQATHCGTCFQCIDRRIAAYAAEAEGYDHEGLYYDDVISTDILSGEARTTAVDYVRQAIDLSQCSVDSFQEDYINELTDIIPYLSSQGTELDLVELVYALQHRHGVTVLKGLNRMRSLHDDLRRPLAALSLLGLIETREHLKHQMDRLIDSVVRILEYAIPVMFRPPHKPKNEPDLNQKVAGLLKTHYDDLRSEHPAVSFACARVVPDHELKKYDLVIETKYVRRGTSPSKATDGMAADLTKYPGDKQILFLVYDPTHKIPDDTVFIKDFETKGRCRVTILR